MSKSFYSLIINTLKVLSQRLAKTSITGLDNIPESGGAILAPNHVSNINPILLGVSVSKRRQLKAMGKDSLFRVPVVGFFLTKMGHIPVMRGAATAGDALEEAIKQVKLGEPVGVYPEGTIPHDLDKVGKLKTGAARLALSSGVPIIPVAQWGAQYVVPRHARLKDFLKALVKRPKHHIVVGRPLKHRLLDGHAKDDFTASDVIDVTLVLAEELERMVSELRDQYVVKSRVMSQSVEVES